MPVTAQQIAVAKAVQTRAAHDASPQIRLVAGPGTGKSFSIGERVAWLIGQGVNSTTIFAVSFTRAAATDLKNGILKYCATILAATQIRVSTLHSLALSILAQGGQLAQFPTSPRVLDDWEQRFIFDEELKSENGFPIKRCGELRVYFEAIWSTGNPPLPFISSPTPPISTSEMQAFQAFHTRRSQLYSCLLPGEAVKRCVDNMRANIINARNLLSMEHLIVDEYQDLNSCDVEFVDLLARSGVTVLVSGDDDQSIYSFRYAYPNGIQTFSSRHHNAGQHALQLCFRCTPSVLGAATNVLANNASPGRIPKALQSAYSTSSPPVQGSVTGLSFTNDNLEADAIAQSVHALIDGGLHPEDILILLASRHHQLTKLESSMRAQGVQMDVQQEPALSSKKCNRFLYCMLRILKTSDDYLAYRTLLGLRNGVGVKSCVKIANVVLNNHLNYKGQFGTGRSAQLFEKRENTAIDGVLSVVNSMIGWNLADTMGQRSQDISSVISTHLSQADANNWSNFAQLVPPGMTLDELLSVFAARSVTDARQELTQVYQRLNQPVPPELDPTGRVRVMTLHSSKGLSAKVVFIPGLEEELLPGSHRAPYPGQVEEAARLLYVGITRARADCILSFSRQRFVNGATVRHNPSRFASQMGLVFQSGGQGLQQADVLRIIQNCMNL